MTTTDRDCPDHGDPIECSCQAERGQADGRRQRYAAPLFDLMREAGWDGERTEQVDREMFAIVDAVMAVADTEVRAAIVDTTHWHAKQAGRLRDEIARLRAELSSVTFARNEGREGNLRMRAEITHLRKEAAEVRAAALTGFADRLVAYCPDHGRHATCYIACYCPVADDMRREAAAAARPDDTRTETGPTEPPTPRCAHCRHPKRDHSDRRDHKPHPTLPRDPWCHACNAHCDYATQGAA